MFATKPFAPKTASVSQKLTRISGMHGSKRMQWNRRHGSIEDALSTQRRAQFQEKKSRACVMFHQGHIPGNPGRCDQAQLWA